MRITSLRFYKLLVNIDFFDYSCRKKMKQFKRRGDLEFQQLSASSSLNNIGTLQQPQPIFPRNVLRQTHSTASTIHRTDTLTNAPPSPVQGGFAYQGYSHPDRARDCDRDDSGARCALVAAVTGACHQQVSHHSHKNGSATDPPCSHTNTRVPTSPAPASIDDGLPASNVGHGGTISRPGRWLGI